MTVLVLLIGLGAGSFTAWAAINTKGEGFVHDRIAVEVQPTLDDHQKRIESLEKSADDMAQMKVDIATIRTMLCDFAPHPPPSCYRR